MWHNDCHTYERMSICCIGYTLFKILQCLTEPINLSTCILHSRISKFDVISALENWLLLFWARRFKKNLLAAQCSSTENLLFDISSCYDSTQSSTPDFLVKALSPVEPGKTLLNKSSAPWGESSVKALPVTVFL